MTVSIDHGNEDEPAPRPRNRILIGSCVRVILDRGSADLEIHSSVMRPAECRQVQW
ncbi:hypothetical protein ABT369_29965 [Dactylosporangium sp. NPDC000244]|uniref:hypothetical protein n=1 Tax=Dactylosporangium sp. NPDC000244 TaxID=3154365 RepID=UPI003322BC27